MAKLQSCGIPFTLSRLCWRMKVRVESAPSPGDHKPRHRATQGSPLLWHGGKGTFLSLHPEISRYVSFANSNSCACGAPESMEIAAFRA